MSIDHEQGRTSRVEQILSQFTVPTFQRRLWRTDSPEYIGFRTGIGEIGQDVQENLILRIIGNLSKEKTDQALTPVWNTATKVAAITATPLIGRTLNDPSAWARIQSGYSEHVRGLGQNLDPNNSLYALLAAGYAIAPYVGNACAMTDTTPTEIASPWSHVQKLYGTNPGWRDLSPMVNDIRATAAVTFLEGKAYQAGDINTFPLLDEYRRHPTATIEDITTFIADQKPTKQTLRALQVRQKIILHLLQHPNEPLASLLPVTGVNRMASLDSILMDLRKEGLIAYKNKKHVD
jgi:hypothetical protein